MKMQNAIPAFGFLTRNVFPNVFPWMCFCECNSNLLLVDWHDQVNNIAVKFNRANALILKIRNYVNTETLRNIYFAIFDSHPSYKLLMYYLGSKY